MGIRLEKLTLPTKDELSTLPSPELLSLALDWRERLEIYQEQLFKARRQRYGKSSERSSSPREKASEPPKRRDETTKRPSERYPDATVHVDRIPLSAAPPCPCCGETMADSGMSEDSEYLDVMAKEFIVVEQKRSKYRCRKCHSAIVTAPAPPRVTPGGSYSDEIIVDAALSKYCDLIPMERYCQMAARGGLPGLPPQSLIQTTFKLAEFLGGVYTAIRNEVLDTKVLLADETPHRMLEGDERTRWYLWGFSNARACFFECHNTRSGDVSSAVLAKSQCLVLLTDVYSGYAKALRVVNEMRQGEGRPPIKAAYCNAHARRGFVAGDDSSDAKFMVAQYQEIYHLETTGGNVIARRAAMAPIFEGMRTEAEKKIHEYSSKSQLGRAYAYFINNYEGLTLFLDNAEVPIDNNASERLLRSHVIGRKTWYGTHSPDGAETAAIHFTIVETCKMNGVNPRAYYLATIQRIHAKQDLLTPSQYKELQIANTC